MGNKKTLAQKKVKSGVDGKLSTKSKYASKIGGGRTSNSPFNGDKVSGEKFVSGFHFFKPIDEE